MKTKATQNPIAQSLSDKFMRHGRTRLKRDWTKSIARLDSDPDGAITAARSLLETTCKHILEAIGAAVPENAALPELYRAVSVAMKLAASGQTNRLYKQFLGATHTIVQSVGELRNKEGDAHGKGHHAVRPSRAQAELAVNLAGAVSNFLISTCEDYLTATRRLTKDGDPILKFDKTIVWRLVDHAENSPAHKKRYGQRKPGPELWLVGDAGIYLMSNGDPPQRHDGKIAGPLKVGETLLLTAHAEGCDWMDEVDHWVPLHNAVAGGDDFGLPISVRAVRQALAGAEKQIVLIFGQESYIVMSDVEYDASPEGSPLDG